MICNILAIHVIPVHAKHTIRMCLSSCSRIDSLMQIVIHHLNPCSFFSALSHFIALASPPRITYRHVVRSTFRPPPWHPNMILSFAEQLVALTHLHEHTEHHKPDVNEISASKSSAINVQRQLPNHLDAVQTVPPYSPS